MGNFASRLVEACDKAGFGGYGQQNEIRRRLKANHSLSVSGQCVHNWFKGATQPRRETLDKLASVLNVEPSWLIFGQDSPDKSLNGGPSETTNPPINLSTTRPVRLTQSLWEFVDEQVKSGVYEDSGDVLRAALREFQASHRSAY